MYSKKGQMGIMETILIIFVLFILIGFGLFFFFKFSVGSYKEQASETCMFSSNEQLLTIANLPQVQCSFAGVSTSGCIDVYKLVAFAFSGEKKILNQGNCLRSVELEFIYPPSEKEKVCKDINEIKNPDFPDNCNKIIVYQPDPRKVKKKKKTIISSFVGVYFPDKGVTRVGKLVLGVYK